MVRRFAILMIGLVWCSVHPGPCNARGLKTIEERCLLQKRTDTYNVSLCKYRITHAEASKLKNGSCSHDFCFYKIKAVGKDKDGANSRWSGSGFYATKSPYGFEPKFNILDHGYKWVLRGSKNQIAHFTQGCGAACHMPPEWDSGSFRGAKLSEVGDQLLIRIPRQ